MPYTQQDLENQRAKVKSASETSGKLYSASGTFPTLVRQKLAEMNVAEQPPEIANQFSMLQNNLTSMPDRVRQNTISTTGGVNIDPTQRQAIEARARAGIGGDYDMLSGLRDLAGQITPAGIGASVRGIEAEAERVRNVGAMESDIMN